jgi:ribosomal protein S18 acetylase RimI-like enzyme
MSSISIKPYTPNQLDAVVALSLRAWAPVFASIEQMMDAAVYRHLHPDWRSTQKKAVEDVCDDENTNVWVAMENDIVIGFVAVKLHHQVGLGEIYMIAVDPAFQRRGAGSALTLFVLDWMSHSGVSVAMVETGADPGHAPARRTYEKMGFGLLPISRYFKKL